MRPVFSAKAPVPGGHYSQAIESGGLLFISGQLPIDPASGKVIAGSIEDEARRALANLTAVLEAGGLALENVAKVCVYVSSIDLWPEVNRVYGEFFGSHRPARSVVPCGGLHHGARIEIDAIAVSPDGSRPR